MDSNAAVEHYYSCFESRVGLRLMFNHQTHHPYFEKDTKFPTHLSEALCTLEDMVIRELEPNPGDLILDAGCGAGMTAIRLAEMGVRVQGIDMVPKQISRANKAAASAGLGATVTFVKGNFHSLPYPDASLDGVYCLESLAQTADAPAALREFHRVLKPGGRIAIADVETGRLTEMPPKVAQSIIAVRHLVGGHWPEHGSYASWLAAAGFGTPRVEDITDNVTPIGNLLRPLAAVPYAVVVKPLRLAKHFPNTFAAHRMYSAEAKGCWRYKIISAQKPEEAVDPFADPVKMEY